jgi:uncharacterized protein
MTANQLVLKPICLPRMDIPSQNPEFGFQFPGVFEIAAMGTAGVGLEEKVPQMLEAVGIIVFRDTFSSRASSGGKYVSIRISFEAQNRTQYETAHRILRENPDVKWTL